jgi:hypothetical protein
MTSILFMRALTIGCLYTPLMRYRVFLSGRSRVVSTGAVEAGVIIIVGPVVDHCAVNVGITDNRRIHFPNRGIIMEGASFPPATEEARSIIAEAIVDPAIESDPGAPIAAVPDIGAVCIAPITRSPEEPRPRRHNPVAMNPEIAVLPIGPGAWDP